MKYDVFVSYSHKDKNLVTTLVDRLESFGLTTYFDFRDMALGGIWAEQIREAIENSDNFLILLTESYSESRSLQEETAFALELAKKSGIRILPVVTAPEQLSRTWKLLIGDIQWITGLLNMLLPER